MAVKDRAISSRQEASVQTASPCAALLRACHGTPLSAPTLGTGLHQGSPSGSSISLVPPSTQAEAAGWQREGCGDPLPAPGESAPGMWVLALPQSEVWGEAVRKWLPLPPLLHWAGEGHGSTINR